jgi:hypothetical protein
MLWGRSELEFGISIAHDFNLGLKKVSGLEFRV